MSGASQPVGVALFILTFTNKSAPPSTHANNLCSVDLGPKETINYYSRIKFEIVI